MKAISEMTKKEKVTLINKTVYQKIKRKVHRIIKDTTVYAELRKELYDAVRQRVHFSKVQKDSKGRCHIAQTIPSDYRGIMATIQPKADGKSGLVVFFTLMMYPSNGSSKPFVKNLKPRLTVNKSKNGIQLLWFKDNKPLWAIRSYEDVATYLRKDFANCSSVMAQVYSEISKIYIPEDFVPILKNMTHPMSTNPYAIHGMNQRLFKRFSGSTNPRDLLNRIYGKSGQQSLSKNAFGGIANIKSFASLVIASDVVQVTKSFPTSFFDKLKLADYEIDITYRANYEFPDWAVKDMQYFFKYFNHVKIQNEVINEINSSKEWFHGFPGYASDAGRMLRDICKHATASRQRALWKNIKLFKGTITETHDMIAVEHAKIQYPEKILSYTKHQKMFLHEQKVTDNIISILPKKNHDLVLWGSTQHNCIGSYGERISGKGDYPNIIVGFMNTKTNNWVGHAQITGSLNSNNRWDIVQLRGKNNCTLDKADEIAIRSFLKLQFDLLIQLSSVYDDLNE